MDRCANTIGKCTALINVEKLQFPIIFLTKPLKYFQINPFGFPDYWKQVEVPKALYSMSSASAIYPKT